MHISQLSTPVLQIGCIASWDCKKHLVELILVFISILAHVLDAHQHIWARILVFPNLLFNLYIYTNKQLYGKVIYSLGTVFFHLYAYLKWKGGKTRPPVQVSRTTPAMLTLIMGLGFIGALSWCCLITRYARIPLSAIYLDAFYASFGFVEKWLMSHKKLERWILALLRYPAFAIACYTTGSLILAVHQIILIFIAIYGQIKWHKTYKKT